MSIHSRRYLQADVASFLERPTSLPLNNQPSFVLNGTMRAEVLENESGNLLSAIFMALSVFTRLEKAPIWIDQYSDEGNTASWGFAWGAKIAFCASLLFFL